MKTSNLRLVLLPGVAKLSVMRGIFYSVRANGAQISVMELSNLQGVNLAVTNCCFAVYAIIVQLLHSVQLYFKIG